MVLASAFVQQSCLEKALMRPRIDWFWPRTGAVAPCGEPGYAVSRFLLTKIQEPPRIRQKNQLA